MALEVALLKAVDLLVSALKFYVQKRKKSTDRVNELDRRERLVSEAIRELLSKRPNIHAARAKIEEASLLGNIASEHLLRAEEMLVSAAASGDTAPRRAPGGRRVRTRTTATAKAAVARSSRVKKKAVKKKMRKKRQ